MATARMIKVNATIVFLLGLALASRVADGAMPRFLNNYPSHRALTEAAGAGDGAGAGVTVFSVMNYGAVADNKKDNAQAFIKTWRAACDSGVPAKVLIPQGTFMTSPVVFQGPCKSTVPITVEVQGTVTADTDLSSYSEGVWVAFEYINGLIVTGSGVFDGRGESAWAFNDCHKNKECAPLPDSIKIFKVANLIVQGITSLNSKFFHFHIVYCTNVNIYNVTITAPSNSPNTDGIHISNSNIVNVTSTKIGTGDDCISIGQGTTNVTVNKVFCGPGHGLSVGSLGRYPNEKDVSGVVISNCTLFNTTNGARIKTIPASMESRASQIVFQDLIIDHVKNPIVIDQKYGSRRSEPSRVKISNVNFKNIKGTSTSNMAVSLMCSSLAPCDGVQLEDIDLTYVGLKAHLNITTFCENINVTTAGILNPPPCH